MYADCRRDDAASVSVSLYTALPAVNNLYSVPNKFPISLVEQYYISSYKLTGTYF